MEVLSEKCDSIRNPIANRSLPLKFIGDTIKIDFFTG